MASVDGQRFSDNASGDGDEYKCERCSNFGLVKEADRFCRECVEYMCVSCAEIHVLGFRALRNHTVVCCGEEHSFNNKKVAGSANINVPAHSYITGSTITPDGRLVLVDNGGRQIILLDKHFTIQSTLTLQGDPWDVAADGDNDGIVSMGDNKQLQWIHLDGDLRAGRTVTTSGPCYGVAVHSGHIYISVISRTKYPYRGHVEVLTRDGSEVRRIGVDASGAGTFTNPYYITVGTSGTLYVANGTREGRITCFSSTGGTVYEVTHIDMQYPRGMVADDDGNLLVCCQGSNNVRWITNNGSHNMAYLTTAEGLAKPDSMAYRRSDGTLIVTLRDKPFCRVYKIK